MDFINSIKDFFSFLGLSDHSSNLILCLFTLFLAFLANWMGKTFLLQFIRHLISKSRNTWDDIFLQKHVFDRLSQFIPVIIIYIGASLIFGNNSSITLTVQKLCLAFIIVLSYRILDSFLNACLEIYRHFEISKHRPIRTYVQFVKIALGFISGILLISIFLDKSPWGILSGLGAMTAILLLVFKDSITGFVASIQLSANDMIRRGDWIEMPSFGADGDVIEVTINTVKVQNWDKTITTIPTHALVNHSFKNWRGMSESSGRRIKRTLNIDMQSVHFCTPKELENYKKIAVIREYLEDKEKDIQSYNATLDKNFSNSLHLLNGRCQSNLGIFRAYIKNYLRQHPKINQDMTFLIRQLQSGSEGLPLEIYVFSADKEWAHYEDIQSDIFDHIIAAVSQFDLKIFQHPSGSDFKALLSTEKS
jgi:miniconductance mechanosensitive channel